MIFFLRIHNFALIDQLELDFSEGLNVLTGETGAGKSIILDAIDVVLGGKIHSRMIRQGATKASIESHFIVNVSLQEWLKNQEIDLWEEDTLVCSRELALSSDNLRSRFRVNGVLVNRHFMAQLREYLVEITAQGQTVQLMIPEMQRKLLDLYGAELILPQRQLVVSAHEKWQEIEEVLEKRKKSEQERLQRLDLLQYQLKELEKAQLKEEDELEQLQQERERLAHVVELQQLSYQVYQSLYQQERDESAATDLLAQAETILTQMIEYDSSLETILEMVKTALTQIIEAGQQINTYGDNLEADPDRLEEIENRIRLLKQICRKYGPSLAEAVAYESKLTEELKELTDTGISLEELEKQARDSLENLLNLSTQLTKLRQETAAKLEKKLVEELKPLAMEKVIFQCKLSPCSPTVNGCDLVNFYFSPNAGEKIQPLSATASGGEMSRFLLALKACFANTEIESKTLIFDEIDAGVSGKVAEAIANKLHELSQFHQVLCVTHQPLVAAMAEQHFRVDKQVIEAKINDSEMRTVVRVDLLKDRQMITEELALLTGGNSAQDALTFAQSLLAKATVYRQKNKKKQD